MEILYAPLLPYPILLYLFGAALVRLSGPMHNLSVFVYLVYILMDILD